MIIALRLIETKRMNYLTVLVTLICSIIYSCDSHGYLYDPPSRSTMWRWPEFKDKVKVNNDDNALRCAGNKYRIKCGVCGDPVYGPKKNMAGGEYANGIISRTYLQGQTILVKVKITASHHGYFEFHICPNNNFSKPVTEECLSKHPLRIGNGSFRYPEGGRGASMHRIPVKLPVGIICSQCVLRWKYITDNNPGGDWIEQYRGCADIAVLKRGFIGVP